MENKQINNLPDELLEQKIAHIMGEKAPEPELVNKKMKEAYDSLRMPKPSHTPPSKKKKLPAAVKFSTVAAVLALAMVYCIKNPAIAAQLPFIGNIFRDLEEQVSFPGDYSSHSTKLDAAANHDPASTEPSLTDDSGSAAQADTDTKETDAAAYTANDDATQTATDTKETDTTAYTAEADGVTVTLSEIAYDRDSIYVSILVQNEKGFVKKAQYPNLLFYDAQVKLQKANGKTKDFNYETEGIFTIGIEGKYVDAHTFQGIYQFHEPELDLSKFTACDLTFSEFEQLLTTGETEIITIPDYGEVSRTIPNSVHYQGPWSFHLDLESIEIKEQTITVHETNADGFGIEKVVMTPYAIYAVPILPDEEKGEHYVAAIWDAHGEALEPRDFGEYLTMSVYGRDVSTVTIYLLKEQDFLDYKGENSYVQPEKAVYQTTVSF